MNINKVFVTGSRGFVGTHLCNRLREEGMNVTTDFRGGTKIDVTEIDQISDCVGNNDAIIHLGAKTWIDDWKDKPYQYYYTNLLGTLNILEAARLRDIRKLIFVSTYVYGKAKYFPIDEKHPPNPHFSYNKSKFLAESLCKYYSYDFSIDTVTLRPFYLYGPGCNPNSFVPSVIRQIRKNGRLILSGKYTKRDFLFISDFVSLVVNILRNFPKEYSVYNVGSGTSYSLERVARIIGQLLGREVRIEYNNMMRPDDVVRMRADVSKASTIFHWRPTVSIFEGLRMTLRSLAT